MLPCEGDGESLERVAQRDILTSSSQNHFPLELLARRARSYLARALCNTREEGYLVAGTGDPWVVQSRAAIDGPGTSTSLPPS